MSYSSGMLEHRITVLEPVREGGVTKYREGCTLWGAVNWAKGVRALRAGEVTVYETVMIRTRWTPSERLNIYCRLKCQGKYYVIESLNADHRANTVQITAREVAQP